MEVFKKLLLFSIMFAIILTPAGPDDTIESDYKIGFELLKSKISDLESQMNENTEQLRSKEGLIIQKEKTAQWGEGTVSYEEQVGKARARGDEVENTFIQMDWSKQGKLAMKSLIKKILERKTHAEKWVEPHFENTKTYLLERKIRAEKWVEPHFENMKTILEKKTHAEKWVEPHFENTKTYLLERKTRAEKWVEPHFENMKTYFLEMYWNKHGKPTVESTSKEMEEKGEKIIDLKEWMSKNELAFIQLLHEYVNTESKPSKMERYKAQNSDDVVTSDPYSIEECMDALETIADLDDNSYNMALGKFKDADWRKMFIKMPSKRRKSWLESLV